MKLLGQAAGECQCCTEDEENHSIEIELVEFMRNFELLDIAHVRPHFSSYFYACALPSRRPTAFEFTLALPSEVYFTLHRDTRPSSIVLILAATDGEQLSMVSGKRETVFADVSLHCESLQPGRYVLYCEGSTEGECLLRVYTPSVLQLKQVQLERVPFLEHVFLERAKAGEVRPFGKDPEDWCSCGLMLEELGWGFVVVKLGENSKLTCSVKYQAERLAREGFKLLNRTS